MLNALRHHGEDDLALLVALPIADDVLNALRHHGEDDVRAADVAYQRACACSTPCGITARTTGPGALRANRAALVLNALRHHGEDDLPDPAQGTR